MTSTTCSALNSRSAANQAHTWFPHLGLHTLVSIPRSPPGQRQLPCAPTLAESCVTYMYIHFGEESLQRTHTRWRICCRHGELRQHVVRNLACANLRNNERVLASMGYSPCTRPPKRLSSLQPPLPLHLAGTPLPPPGTAVLVPPCPSLPPSAAPCECEGQARPTDYFPAS